MEVSRDVRDSKSGNLKSSEDTSLGMPVPNETGPDVQKSVCPVG